MTNRLNLLLAFCGLLLTSPSIAAQCTPETEASRRVVYDFATRAGTTRPASVPVVTADRVRLLTNASDAGVCQQLYNVFWPLWQNPDEPKTDWQWAYYQVGDHYYVFLHKTTPPVTRNPDGTLNISLRWTPLLIIDRNYQVVARIAS
jgi:hypothetical protein